MTRHLRAGVTLTALLALADAAVAVAQPFPRALARPRERTIDTQQAPKVVDPSRRTADTGEVPPGACDGAAASSQACADAIWRGLREAIGLARIAGEFDEAPRRLAYRQIEDRLQSAMREMSIADDERKWARAMKMGIDALDTLRKDTEHVRRNTSAPPASSGQDAKRDDETGTPTKEQWSQRRDRLAALIAQLTASAVSGPPPRQLDTKSFEFLGGAGVSTGTAVPEVTVQAVDVYFTNRWRLHVRTTVAVSSDDDAAEQSAGEGDGDEGDADPEPSAADVDDAVKSALLNPTGGLLNVSAGYYRKLPTFILTGAADDASHGLFFDARAGVRFLEMPDQTLRNADGPSSLTPLLSASLGLWLVLPVFDDAGLTTSAGKVGIHAAYMVNHFTSTTSALLESIDGKPPVLERTTRSVFAGAAIKLTRFADLSISGTLWSNTDFDRRLMVSIGLVKND